MTVQIKLFANLPWTSKEIISHFLGTFKWCFIEQLFQNNVTRHLFCSLLEILPMEVAVCCSLVKVQWLLYTCINYYWTAMHVTIYKYNIWNLKVKSMCVQCWITVLWTIVPIVDFYLEIWIIRKRDILSFWRKCRKSLCCKSTQNLFLNKWSDMNVVENIKAIAGARYVISYK